MVGCVALHGKNVLIIFFIQGIYFTELGLRHRYSRLIVGAKMCLCVFIWDEDSSGHEQFHDASIGFCFYLLYHHKKNNLFHYICEYLNISIFHMKKGCEFWYFAVCNA